MANELYPVFDIPTVDEADTNEEAVYKPTPLFDYERGDFVRNGANRIIMVDGREAYRMWVLKTLKTQLGACAAYPGLGLDYEGASAETERSAVEATFERAITEALLRHPMTQRVRDFLFALGTDSMTVSFTVQGKDLPVLPVSETYKLR